ncbi:MAG: hypothetical protein KDA45_00990 [Planctomycetales bacterium]|nr:hypothetical protein [Planctomycetales bacterium]
MGDLRFTSPHARNFDSRVWETAYITGIEGIPWHCHHTLVGDQFNIGRQIDESGKLNILWPTKNYGNLCLSTTSLRISEAPYDLGVEVARGAVCKLRNQTSEWQRLGLRLPDKFFPLAEDALSQLLRSLTSAGDPDKQLQHAQESINLAIDASVLLCNTFSLQSLEARRQGEGRLSTLLGLQLPSELPPEPHRATIAQAFNLICIPAEYGTVASTPSSRADYEAVDQQLAWAQQQNQKICFGPLVNFRPGGLPQWMILLSEGFDSVLSAACEYAQQTVERYRGQAHLWNCAAGLNIPNELGWSDEEILRMAVSLIETVRRADDRCPVLLTIDQPWSEYLRDDADGISPLHFADALIRADLGLSGLALDLNMDCWPGGSFPRDPLEVNRLIDRWSMLGLPLMVILNSPLEAEEGPGLRLSNWSTGLESKGIMAPEPLIRLLLSKPSVHAVIWNNQPAKKTPSRGLWNDRGTAQPLLNSLATLRKSLLH